MLLGELLAPHKKLMPADLLATDVPRDVESFREGLDDSGADVAELLAQGRALVEAAERLVCALYGVPADLEDDVVAHAVARTKVTDPSSR